MKLLLIILNFFILFIPCNADSIFKELSMQVDTVDNVTVKIKRLDNNYIYEAE